MRNLSWLPKGLQSFLEGMLEIIRRDNLKGLTPTLGEKGHPMRSLFVMSECKDRCYFAKYCANKKKKKSKDKAMAATWNDDSKELENETHSCE